MHGLAVQSLLNFRVEDCGVTWGRGMKRPKRRMDHRRIFVGFFFLFPFIPEAEVNIESSAQPFPADTCHALEGRGCTTEAPEVAYRSVTVNNSNLKSGHI